MLPRTTNRFPQPRTYLIAAAGQAEYTAMRDELLCLRGRNRFHHWRGWLPQSVRVNVVSWELLDRRMLLVGPTATGRC